MKTLVGTPDPDDRPVTSNNYQKMTLGSGRDSTKYNPRTLAGKFAPDLIHGDAQYMKTQLEGIKRSAYDDVAIQGRLPGIGDFEDYKNY